MSGPPMTCQQRRYISGLLNKLDDDDPETVKRDGIASADLNIVQASQLIAHLKARIEQARSSRKD